MLSDPVSSLEKENLAFEMETPFGNVVGTARCTKVPDQHDPTHTFLVTNFIGQGREILKGIQDAAKRNRSRNLVKYAPDNPQFPNLRTCYATGLPSLAAILLLAIICVWTHPRYTLLTRIGRLSQPTTKDLVQLDKLTAETLNNEIQDARLVAKLRSVLTHLEQEEMASKVLHRALALAPNNPGLILAGADHHVRVGSSR